MPYDSLQKRDTYALTIFNVIFLYYYVKLTIFARNLLIIAIY